MKLASWMLQVITMSTPLLTSTVAQSPNCGWQTIDKDSSSPMFNPTGLTCANSKCCSKDGFCTSGTSDCQAGCQSDFGTCNPPVCGFGVAGDADNHVCGQTGQCCSSEGFCGTDDGACGIGCQYGACKHVVPWIEGNDPSGGNNTVPLPEFPEYSSGKCMKDVYNNFAQATGDQHPVCRAKEVHSLTATLHGDNPQTCEAGDMISVTFMAGFTSNSAVGRQDIALYTAQNATCHGDTPSANERNCARDGDKCSVHILGQYDQEALSDSRIRLSADRNGVTDTCGDIDTKGTFAFAPRSIDIPCVGKYENGAWTNQVVLQACLSWRQPGGDIDCDKYGAFPGTTSKCTCEYIPLPITINPPKIEIITLLPTTQPSKKPTAQPTNQPSKKPTSHPTSQPSKKPSAQPTDAPSKKPSAQPTDAPSKKPSAQPTDAPSKKPTDQPSKKPTFQPTSQPTNQPSKKPTVKPTVQPTEKPTVKPTAKPTSAPSRSPTNKPTASAELGNRVWDDWNANGVQDPGEPGLSNVEVLLRNENGLIIAKTLTDRLGYYRFTGLVPGTYSVDFVLPSDYKFTMSADLFGDLQFDTAAFAVDGSSLFMDVTSDAHVESGSTDQVDLLPGETNLSLDAGVYRPSKINGIVWHDLNADGVRGSQEPGVAGASITLYNDDDEIIATVTTDSLGAYVFEGLKPDSYYGVIQAPNSDYFLSPMGKGTLLTDSDFDPSTKKNSPVTLLSGDNNIGSFDAGLYMLASVGDFVWLDLNFDGIQGIDEPGFPFPITINLYDYLNKKLLSTLQTDDTGAYLFDDLVPGNYELEFILEEGDILSPAFKGNDENLDSNVDGRTSKAIVTLISGESNNSVDAGIIADAPYYPDWTFETQVCTNDGFDPEWMSNNEGRIYLYRNKEECCQNHFWWRMTQCMANEQYKFYRNGEQCDVKIDFDFWEGEATWSDSTLFDTRDECCANLFYYDFSGCMARSPVEFKFDFCLDLASLVPPQDCQTADIYANVIEDVINAQLGSESDANITRIGDVSLGKIAGGAGSTTCGGSLGGEGFINDSTGTPADLSNPPQSTTVCGVISTRSTSCTQEDCLTARYDSIVSDMSTYVNDGSMTATLQARATTRLPPVPELKQASSISGTFTTTNLLLPATISSELGESKYFKDGTKCGTKTAFASWETPYDTLLDCCKDNFNWELDACCAAGGGCGASTTTLDEAMPVPEEEPVSLYYPTWTSGSLCQSKPSDQFEEWDTNYNSLADCCKAHFLDYGYDDCCQSSGMGGCVSVSI